MSRVTLPKIDTRTATLLFRRLREMVPHYTREWSAKDEDDPGVGLLKIFCFLADGVIQRLNRAPERDFLCFLDLLGIRLLPETPAIVPVRFLVATGTTESILVRTATQVSAAATAEHPELPFETTQELQAVPAALSALFAVDPSRDVILRPPPGFLVLEIASAPHPPYRVAAFSSAGSKSLQLDLVDQLEKGDFLRIQTELGGASASQCCSPREALSTIGTDHLIVSDIKGNIVLLTDPLPRDYTEDTLVEKVTRFDLLDGKNFQEHILFLGHANLFNVKSEAKFELVFAHAPGGTSDLQPLRIAWEFFGATVTAKQEGWHGLTLEADGTSGLSTKGRILLTKPAGEIKETEINGNKNRWIRARLDAAIPATPPPSVPRVESVALRVSSAGNGLPADLAFHNDTPQEVNFAFNPFGVEPRIFDRFYLASKEAFSKPGAEIDIKMDLENVDLLASPAAVFQNGLLRAFAHGAAGRLVEFRIDPSGAVANPFKNHLKPTDTRIAAGSIPAPVVADGVRLGVLGVFVRTEDDRIFLRFLGTDDAAASQWIDLKNPKDIAPQHNPAAILEGNQWRVFTVAGGQLYSRLVDPNNPDVVVDWRGPLPGQSITIASTPFVINEKWIFASDDQDQAAYRYNGSSWTSLNQVVAKHSRPCAILFDNDTQAKIFLRDPAGDLIYLQTAGDLNTAEVAKNLPKPSVPLASDPSVVATPDGLRVYARGEDNHLWSIYPEADDPAWASVVAPSETSLFGDPFPIAGEIGPTNQKRKVVSVLSSTNKNSLVELRNDLGGHRGLLQAGPRDLVILQSPPGSAKYIHISGGPSKGDLRKILSVPNLENVALLEKPLSIVSTARTKYELLKKVTDGLLQDAAETSATLQVSAANIKKDDYLLVGDQLRIIDSILGNVVTLKKAWDRPIPETDDPYVVLRGVGSGNAQAGAKKLIILAVSASSTDDAYQNLPITIQMRSGAQVTGTISRYTGANKLAEVSLAFRDPPLKDTQYEISQGNPFEGWLQYRDPDQTELRPELSWEYWNGTGWVTLHVTDTTSRFLVSGHITFQLPDDIANTEVAGQDNFWIRARIVGGDYGRELFTVDPVTGRLEIKKDPIRPPLIKSLLINYSFTQDLPPQACVTFNNLSYLDQTAANVTPDKYFFPFEPVPDKEPAVYFGFDKPFQGGPVRLYAAATELRVDDRNEPEKPKFAWTFETDNQWKPVLAEDNTNALTRPGIITWSIPGKFQERVHFGETRYWVRASLVVGAWSASPVLSGLFLNTAMARQARTFLDEILGSSDGTAGQSFRLVHLPVLEGEEIRVREVLTDEERQQLIAAEGEDAISEIRDLEQRVLESWIHWREVDEFFRSTSESRHYRLDRASGELQFGDGVHGKIPPGGGDNIRAFSYQAGGGAAGNVRAGEITSLVTSVGGIDSVINPVDAGGGSERATPEQMLEIGPAQISNRDRAVTPEDFEWLAKEASREVRKARCVANRNAQGRREPGWVSVYIVPDSTEPAPMPSLELRRSVTRYLARRADLGIVSQEHISVGAPEYVRVGVQVTVFARSLDETALAELNVRKKLDEFLHPLTGGPEEKGWEFGRELAASDIYRLLEEIKEVDHVGPVQLLFGDKESTERAEIGPNALIAPGEHFITTSVANGREQHVIA